MFILFSDNEKNKLGKTHDCSLMAEIWSFHDSITVYSIVKTQAETYVTFNVGEWKFKFALTRVIKENVKYCELFCLVHSLIITEKSE